MEHARPKHPESFKSRYIQKEINHLYASYLDILKKKFITFILTVSLNAKILEESNFLLG